MSFSIRTLFAVVAIALVSGCAGTDFKRPDSGVVVVGKSTPDDVMRVMGTPRQTGEVIVNEQKVKTMTYVFAAAGGEPTYPGVVPARAMTFATFQERVVGQEFVSSFKQDASEFDDSRIASIVKGRTTRQEVLALLGKPSGEAVYPMIKQKDHTGLIYTYAQAKGTVFNMKFHSKSLTVSFTPGDLVADVDYKSVGEK
ncbi:MAG TPA: hypothetical protein VF522_00880 [Ramlibacter sp.]|uniref:hypothetical protein n=1 Tax=Ramlibacter sp. TaxID=1917967 RepID=UPI002ED372E7